MAKPGVTAAVGPTARQALGRGMPLGAMYDARNERFTGVIAILTSNTSAKFHHGLDQHAAKAAAQDLASQKRHMPVPILLPGCPSVFCEFVLDTTFEDRCQALDLNASMKMSVMSLPLEVSGSAKFVTNKSHVSKVVCGSLVVKIRTGTDICTEMSSDQLKISAAAYAPDAGTHVVAAIDYGMNAFIDFESRYSTNEEKLRLEGEMKAMGSVMGAALSGSLQITANSSELKRYEHWRVKIFAEVGLTEKSTIPLSPAEAIVFIKDLPGKLALVNNGRGNPQTYHLYPLNSLPSTKADRALCKLEQDLDEAAVAHTAAEVAKLDRAIANFNDLYESATKARNVLDEHLYKKFEDMSSGIETFSKDWRFSLGKVVTAIRSGKAEYADLEKQLAELSRGAYGPCKIDEFVHRLGDHALAKIRLFELFAANGAMLLDRKTTLDMCWMQPRSAKFAYVLYTKNGASQPDDLTHPLFLSLRNQENAALIVVDLDLHNFPDITPPLIMKYSALGLVLDRNYLRSSKELGCTLTPRTPSDVQKASLHQLSKEMAALPSLTFACPGSIADGGCGPENKTYACVICREIVKFDAKNSLFVCKCGRLPALPCSGWQVKCDAHLTSFSFSNDAIAQQWLACGSGETLSLKASPNVLRDFFTFRLATDPLVPEVRNAAGELWRDPALLFAPRCIRIETSVEESTLIFYRFEIKGYDYGHSRPIDCTAVGYTNTKGAIRNAMTTSLYEDTSCLEQEVVNGKVHLKLYLLSGYHPSFSISAYFVPNGTTARVISHDITPFPAAPWLPLDLQPAWHRYDTAFGTAEYRRIGGQVHLRGLVASTANTAPSVIGVLPPFHRPARQMIFASDSANAHARVDIRPDGAVVLQFGSTGNVSLYGISFVLA